MRLGLSISNFTWSPDQQLLGDTFGLMVERAERAGLYSLWVPDHFFQIPWIGPPEQEMLEGWSATENTADLASEGFDQIIMPNVTDQDLFDLLATKIVPMVEAIPVAGR